MLFLCTCYTFSSTKSYDMHKGFHDWLVNSGEMLFMSFSKGSSPTVKDMWLQDQDKVIKNYKHLPHNMYYKAQTSKV